jgi:hypothetical protein
MPERLRTRGDAMENEEGESKSWLRTFPGLLTTIAAVLTAVTGLVAAISGLLPTFSSRAPAPIVQSCIAGYVWREAYPEDHVCVTQETHMRALQDNQLAGSRRKPGGGASGADTCDVGFVWRDAFPGDRVCVTVETRTQAAQDNREAGLRVNR